MWYDKVKCLNCVLKIFRCIENPCNVVSITLGYMSFNYQITCMWLWTLNRIMFMAWLLYISYGKHIFIFLLTNSKIYHVWSIVLPKIWCYVCIMHSYCLAALLLIMLVPCTNGSTQLTLWRVDRARVQGSIRYGARNQRKLFIRPTTSVPRPLDSVANQRSVRWSRPGNVEAKLLRSYCRSPS